MLFKSKEMRSISTITIHYYHFKEDKEGVRTMCRAMEEMRAEAAAEAEQRKEIMVIKNLMANMKWSLEQALSALGIAASEQEKYRRLVMA